MPPDHNLIGSKFHSRTAKHLFVQFVLLFTHLPPKHLSRFCRCHGDKVGDGEASRGVSSQTVARQLHGSVGEGLH